MAGDISEAIQRAVRDAKQRLKGIIVGRKWECIEGAPTGERQLELLLELLLHRLPPCAAGLSSEASSSRGPAVTRRARSVTRTGREDRTSRRDCDDAEEAIKQLNDACETLSGKVRRLEAKQKSARAKQAERDEVRAELQAAQSRGQRDGDQGELAELVGLLDQVRREREEEEATGERLRQDWQEMHERLRAQRRSLSDLQASRKLQQQNRMLQAELRVAEAELREAERVRAEVKTAAGSAAVRQGTVGAVEYSEELWTVLGAHIRALEDLFVVRSRG